MGEQEKKNILIVDDEKEALASLADLFRRNGYGVLTAENGKDGLSFAKEEAPHLIILDLVLPDIDGSDVAAALLQDPATRNIPIIFLTAIVRKPEQEKSGAMIANRCIVAKPCKPQEILTLVRDRIG